jgi:hypothetical protein
MKQPDWMTDTEQYADALFGMTGNIITAFISRLAPFVVPLAPAFFFAFSIYGQVRDMSGNQPLALGLGIIAAAGLETVGIMAAHWAVDFYSRGEDGKARTAIVITVAYLIIGMSGIVLFENTTFNAKVTGVVMFMIAAMVYVLLGLSEDSRKKERAVAGEQERKEARRAEQAAWERQLQLERIRTEHELRLKRIELKATVQPTVVPTVLTADWRKLTLEQKAAMARYSTEQIVRQFGVSDRTAERWKARSRKLSPTISKNGATS